MRRIVIHCEQNSTLVALMDEQRLLEIFSEKQEMRQMVGNIYKGRVVNVLPGMQAAFIDIHCGKNAFLYIDDLLPQNPDKELKIKPNIAQLLHEGDELLVQVMKDPVGTKGAKVTTHFSLPGRWVVYMPEAAYVGVSRKIESEPERERLKSIGEKLLLPGEGLIFRTVAEGEADEALAYDLAYLRDLWQSVRQKSKDAKPGDCVYREPDMLPRIVRDVLTDDVDEIIIDSKAKHRELRRLLMDISPIFADRLHLYGGNEPICDTYGVSEQLRKLFNPKIWLKSGGYIVVDHTEALTVIDVNTGKYTGSVDLEETALRTNLEAAEEIALLLRVKDVGGIVIVDFIDMEKEEHREEIARRFAEVAKRDRTKTLVVGWTRLGLLEITRKKVRNSINAFLPEKCPVCGGTGMAPQPDKSQP
ncbi:MAG TPA: Rne/Rng family ribonuclease [Bacilli bacterium]